MIVARMSSCRSAGHRNNSRKSRVSDVSAMILASMSASWNASFIQVLHQWWIPASWYCPDYRSCVPFISGLVSRRLVNAKISPGRCTRNVAIVSIWSTQVFNTPIPYVLYCLFCPSARITFIVVHNIMPMYFYLYEYLYFAIMATQDKHNKKKKQ